MGQGVLGELEQYIQSYFGIDHGSVSRVAALFRPVQLEKGAFFARQGAACERLAFVDVGLIRVYARSGYKEVTQWISARGHFITDLSALLFQTPARWNIQALSDCSLFEISGEDYRRLREQVADWDRL